MKHKCRMACPSRETEERQGFLKKVIFKYFFIKQVFEVFPLLYMCTWLSIYQITHTEALHSAYCDWIELLYIRLFKSGESILSTLSKGRIIYSFLKTFSDDSPVVIKNSVRGIFLAFCLKFRQNKRKPSKFPYSVSGNLNFGSVLLIQAQISCRYQKSP